MPANFTFTLVSTSKDKISIFFIACLFYIDVFSRVQRRDDGWSIYSEHGQKCLKPSSINCSWSFYLSGPTWVRLTWVAHSQSWAMLTWAGTLIHQYMYVFLVLEFIVW